MRKKKERQKTERKRDRKKERQETERKRDRKKERKKDYCTHTHRQSAIQLPAVVHARLTRLFLGLEQAGTFEIVFSLD